MSLTSWNCRGLGSPSAIPNLKYLVRFYKLVILFLNETLAKRNIIEEFRNVLGFSNCVSVDRVGRSGGLALFCQLSINCQLIDYSHNHITVEIVDNEKGPWRLTDYYGYPNGGRRRASWDFLRLLSNQYALPWCIFGDFNDIMDASEKRNRTMRSNWLINGFRQAVIDCGVSDVPMEGYPFTWFKSLGTPRAVEERLDRALANTAWFHNFYSASLKNLVAPASDHYPILLNCQHVVHHQRSHRGFRFENAWKLEAGLNDLMCDSWLSNNEY
jgi:exonuclease III